MTVRNESFKRPLRLVSDLCKAERAGFRGFRLSRSLHSPVHFQITGTLENMIHAMSEAFK